MSQHQGHSAAGRIKSFKNPMTLSEIEPAIFRLVTEHAEDLIKNKKIIYEKKTNRATACPDCIQYNSTLSNIIYCSLLGFFTIINTALAFSTFIGKTNLYLTHSLP